MPISLIHPSSTNDITRARLTREEEEDPRRRLDHIIWITKQYIDYALWEILTRYNIKAGEHPLIFIAETCNDPVSGYHEYIKNNEVLGTFLIINVYQLFTKLYLQTNSQGYSKELGELYTALAVFHEFTHILQDKHGYLWCWKYDHRYTISLELQADEVSGFITAFLAQNNYINITSRTLEEFGWGTDILFPDTIAHGGNVNRIQAITTGIRNGLQTQDFQDSPYRNLLHHFIGIYDNKSPQVLHWIAQRIHNIKSK